MSTIISWFKWVFEFIEKHGILKTLAFTLVTLVVSYTAFLMTNPKIAFEKFIEYSEQQHNKSFDYRMKSSPMVQAHLDNLKYESGAYRCFIIELHNGKNNATGLSFNYGSLTYESCRNDSVKSVVEDYDDFSIDRYPLAFKVYNNGYWAGTVEELKTVDKHLAYCLTSNDANYIALTVIYGKNSEIGFLGISYQSCDSINTSTIHTMLNRTASKISPLLDGSNAHN